MTAARCPTCDREGCKRDYFAILDPARTEAIAGCDAHAAKIWRGRALAAEASVEEIGKELDTLRDDIAEHLPAYMLGDGDDAEEANPREVVEYAGAELRRASKDAARWRRVKPLIEQLRAWSDAPPIVSAVVREIFANIDDRAAPEGDTP